MAFIGHSLSRQLGKLWQWSTAQNNEDNLRDYAATEAPLRAELFSADQMERHGRTLGTSHRISEGYPADRLLARLAENEAVLVDACRILSVTTNTSRLTPAGEWLLDNFYLIEEQIRTAKRHFPKGYGRGLPRLSGGESIGQPRVYEIALEAIAHGDGRWDLESLSRYVAAYQQASELTLGELWAIPIMLRLALIENLRRVSASIATSTADRNLADDWAGKMIKASEEEPKSLILLIADMARSGPPMGHTFVAELARRLQGQGAALALPLTWMEQSLAEQGQTIEQMVLQENRQQAANQLSISNSIASLRLLGGTNWREFVETMSVVEQTLLGDPAGMYSHMDFATRDNYRHTVERTARYARMRESSVAQQAVALAATTTNDGPMIDSPIHVNRQAHVGFYLTGPGLVRLEHECGARLPLGLRFKRWFARAPVSRYLGPIAVITLGFSGWMLFKAHALGLTAWWQLTILGVVLLLSVSHLAVALINLLATHIATPRFLPRLDYSTGIPPELRTLVAVPAMLGSEAGLRSLIDDLEVRFLGNRDPNLHFALLTDFTDAAEETLPQDAALLAQATAQINALNSQYPSLHGNTFFLFHRPRRWNAREGVWMGYERKRGKLAALNALLRDGKTDDFSLIVGHTGVLSNIKYVITLDTDTQLPRDAARQFIGTMAHPLNHPRFDEQRQRVVEGYAILQPRVAESLPANGPSRYARLSGSEPGIDPYTRTVSDVYQDLFGEGSFIGKGIYDVAAFEQALANRVPENRVLSHDLLEGCYARSGLLSDVALYEASPASYLSDMRRRSRWIRGDWQLAGWLWFSVRHGNGSRSKNPLSVLSRWKLLDNLRRSLVPLALLVLIGMSASVLPLPRLWLGVVLLVLWLPAVLAALLDLVRKPGGISWRQHLFTNGHLIVTHASQLALRLITLPHEAAVNTCAIVRTLWRVHVSHRHLLEWSTSESVSSAARYDLFTFVRAMWIGPVLAVLIAVGAPMIEDPAWLLFAAVLAGLWLVSPLLAWWVSQPPQAFASTLDAEQMRLLHRTARKVWLFFETFVTAGDHWLPPDNFQEVPTGIIAHRTSPTNIGLALLVNFTAYDFGYLPGGMLLERTTNTLNSMLALERYRGHLFNWYDTQSLQPLAPRYVSTVDSGNLAGHLLTLRQGLLALPDEPVLHPRLWRGLSDGLGLVTTQWDGPPPAALTHMQGVIAGALATPPTSPAEACRVLHDLAGHTDQLCALAAATPEQEALQRATASLQRQCYSTLNDITTLLPWATWPPADVAKVPALQTLLLLRDVPGLGALAVDEWGLRTELAEQVIEASRQARDRLALINALAVQSLELAQMEYGFLYDPSVNLLAVGYNVDDNRRDGGRYDLLTSENRLCNFVAIAQGQLPQESWFALGRLLTLVDNEQVMVSWSGSMFEYLMPMLVMPTYAQTLLDTTCRAAVRAQITYGHQCGVPWGISESGYNTTDAHLNYQYRAFGVPGLGLKRGLVDDLVIAPYATIMAMMVAPQAASQNLQKLSAMGAEGEYGFYEAIDYTAARLQRGQRNAMVRSFMAHHQGMSLLSLSYALLGQPMLQRFSADPQCQATMLLLQERVPKNVAVYARAGQFANSTVSAEAGEASIRQYDRSDTPMPEVQLLSNSRYHVMVNNAGTGYSRWKGMAVTRWQEDPTADQLGVFCYLRDLESGLFWSATARPCGMQGEHFKVIFSEAHAEFHRQDQRYDVHSEIVVSPEDDIELRRMRITNRSRRKRVLEVTSYAEVVIAPANADNAHPAFSKLFVESEILPEQQAILCSRRPREQHEARPYLLHLMAVHGADVDQFSCETDRARFIGRGNTLAAPTALLATGNLSNTQGAVLDPIVAVRHHITLEPEATVTLDLVLGMSDTREGAMNLIEKYRDRRLADRVFELAWTHNLVLLRQINAEEADGQLYGRMAGAVLYPNAAQRAEVSVLMNNRRGQSGLWGFAISGDLPIVLLRIADPGRIELVRQLVQAHAYWRLKGLTVDLVILNEDHAGYRQQLQEQIMGLIAAGIEANLADRPGGVFVRNGEQMAVEDRTLLQSVARIIITDNRGSLLDQVTRRGALLATPPTLLPGPASNEPAPAAPRRSTADLLLFNGTGGFAADGREYVIITNGNQRTPAPWCNILANADFGSVISESGSAYTWAGNAHEFRLTPWYNDPIQDTGGEAFYLRDEESGKVWSPAPLPCRGTGEYVTRHGFGYSVFEHEENGIRSELTIYVALDAPVKFSRLRLTNVSGRTRKLTATGYVEWVLGDLRPKTAPYVVTEIAADSGAVLARNSYTSSAGTQVAFFDVDDPLREVTCDRREFIGRNGTHARPVALERIRLSGKVGAALDPCGAIQVPFGLGAGQEREITFRLGVGRDLNDTTLLVQRMRGASVAAQTLEAVHAHWRHTLDAVQVQTPDPAINLLANGWLVYQVLACRLWARSGYYQSGGAYGFRDQIQDTMALVHAEPKHMREHLLLCASRQFAEGDVQHWWHPPTGAGVRTRCSDDYLWLPMALCRYIEVTGDLAILDEKAPYLKGRLLNPDEESWYDQPGVSDLQETLYQHGVRAVLHGLRFGPHDLPLMGSGDWNDGMNLVGDKGVGESVWLGFFLYEVLNQYGALARRHGDIPFAERCANEAAQLQRSLETHAWDGNWYRRAWFDDGTLLGTVSNDECRIDSIAQSWAALSNAASPERVSRAMQSLNENLVRRDDKLIQLLEPPFDKGTLEPGYIKGYVPGVRENGGQYTHAAVWATMAFAHLGDAARAWELMGLINPLNHARDAAEVAQYKVEPYVAAADVYGVAPHTGRGGWTWYTGSAGWMYRLVVESLLGLQREGDTLRLLPRLPADWPGFAMTYRFGETPYHITIARSDSAGLMLDGTAQDGDALRLVDDGHEHQVVVHVSGQKSGNASI